jgi:hypothetical protein
VSCGRSRYAPASTIHSFPSRTAHPILRPMIPPDYEKRIRRASLQVAILCLCAVVPPLFSLTGIFAPEDEALGLWFQRSGIVMTVFAVLAQLKAGRIATTMIAGGTFAETWEAYHKYNRLQALAAWLSLTLVVVGTLIWAYGDLLFPEPPEEQNAIAGRRQDGPVQSSYHGHPYEAANIAIAQIEAHHHIVDATHRLLFRNAWHRCEDRLGCRRIIAADPHDALARATGPPSFT